MSLLESIKADEEALAKLAQEEKEAPADDSEEDKEGDEEEQGAKEEDAADEEKAEPAKEEVKAEEPKIDNAAYARMRLEKAAAEREAREAKAELERLKAEKLGADKEKESAEEAGFELPPEVAEVIEEKRYERAKEHFGVLEREFVGGGDVPDYDGVVNGYVAQLAQAIYTLDPRISGKALEREVERRILVEAAQFHASGVNPAEGIYKKAKSIGIKPFVHEQKEEKPVERRPNLDRVAENKRRSSGMGASGGGAGEVTTLKAAVEMPLGQFAAIPAAELERLERSGR